MSSSELIHEEIQRLWSPEEAFLAADLRVDATTGVYEFDANEVALESTEQGLVLVGHQRRPFGAIASLRIPWNDVSRLWYDQDIVVYIKNGQQLQLHSGEWYMAVEDGRVTALVPVIAESDTLRLSSSGQNMRFSADYIDRIEFPKDIDRATTSVHSVLAILGIAALLLAAFMVLLALYPPR